MLLTGIITLSFQDPLGYQLQMDSQQIYLDTVPDKPGSANSDKDINKDLAEIMDNALQLASEALKKVDMDKLRIELKDAMKKVDMESILADVQRSLKGIDLDKLKDEINSELKRAKNEWTEADKQKFRMELDRARDELKKVDLEKIMQEVRKELEKARIEIDKSKKEIK
jgi:hypothetical protein